MGAPELLPFDAGSLTNREAIELRKLGYKTPRIFWGALRVTPVNDEDGNLEDLILDPQAWTAFVWLALRRVGVQTDVETLEFDLESLQVVQDDEPPEVEEVGKASEAEDSTNSETTS